ncbi:MAG TPA: YfhO family protein [Bryobacteraceae bacterium]
MMKIAFGIKKLLAQESCRAALIFAAILHLCFFPCLWGNRTLLASVRDAPSILPNGAWAGKPDANRFPKTLDEGGPAFITEPLFALARSEYLQEKSFPLWNPYQGYGVPLAANMQSQPFYPLSIALSFCLTPRTYNWYILLRLFAAGMCMFLYLRLFVSFIPALAGGVASLLAGYYVLFLTMPQLSVEVLLPAGLLVAEHLVRKPGYRSLVGFALVLLLTVVGGMPESCLLIFAFLCAYLVFRIASGFSLRSTRLDTTKFVLLATLAGFTLSAFLLIPFWEFLKRDFDLHQPANIGRTFTGLLHDPFGISIFTYFFPFLFGPPSTSSLGPSYTGLRNYTGVIPLFLAVMAAYGGVRKRLRRDRLLFGLTCFFLLSLVALILKRYGFAPVNWVGNLPLFRLVWFGKYEEVIVSICLSALCAIGLERLFRREVSIPLQVTGLLGAFLIVPLALVCSWRTILMEVGKLHVRATIPLLAITVPLCALFFLALAMILFRRDSRTASVPLIVSIFVLLTGELTFNYIAPAYYFFNRLPSQTANPYLGAPFIDLLTTSSRHQDRFFARDGVLFPNWASAFGLFDIRDLDAMYYKKYFPFLRNFFQSAAVASNAVELGDRFDGAGPYDFRDPLSLRLLQLSSVKYLVTMRPFVVSNAVEEDILAQHRERPSSGRQNSITRREFILAGEAREGLGEFPPYRRLPYRLKIGNGQEVFHFSYALEPSPSDKKGGGVNFTIEAKDESGQISKLFSNYLDPRNHPGQRRWMDGEIALGHYRGQSIELLFSTDLAPDRTMLNGWAGWSDFYFDDERPPAPPPFKLIYHGEANVYTYDNVLPRAAIYSHAELAKDEKEVLRKLAAPSLNVFATVVLDKSELNANQIKAAAQMNQSAALPVEAARITSYQSRLVSIKASLDRSGILVLNDSDYPGWSVEVDGHPSNWFSANYLFRGVFLKPGKHVVRFAYRPLSFYTGALISSITLLCLTMVGLARARAKHSPVGAPGSDNNPSHAP